MFRKVWEICRVDRHLDHLGITKKGHPAWLLTFAYAIGAWIGARSSRQLSDAWNRDPYLREGVGGGVTFGAYTWTRFLGGGFVLRRLLAAAVRQLQSWESTACCPEWGVLALDDTPVEKTGSKMEGIRTLWDNAKQRFIRGYSIVNLTYHRGDLTYPVDFRLHPKLNDNDPTKTTLAKRLIDGAVELGLSVYAVVFDAGYCSVGLFRHLDKRGLHWITRLPRNRVVYIGDKRLSVKELMETDWYRFDAVRGVRYICRQGYLNHYELPVEIVVVREPDKEPITLVTSLIETPWHEIRKLYRERFKIETFHRTAKQEFGLADFHYHFLDQIENHVALVYLRYLLGTLMKVVYPELRGLGWMHIRERLFDVIDHLVLEGNKVIDFLLSPTTRLYERLRHRYLANVQTLQPATAKL